MKISREPVESHGDVAAESGNTDPSETWSVSIDHALLKHDPIDVFWATALLRRPLATTWLALLALLGRSRPVEAVIASTLSQLKPESWPIREDVLVSIKRHRASGGRVLLCASSTTSVLLEAGLNLPEADGLLYVDRSLFPGRKNPTPEQGLAPNNSRTVMPSNNLQLGKGARKVSNSQLSGDSAPRLGRSRFPSLTLISRVARTPHWSKNLLVFVPLFLSGELAEASSLGRLVGLFALLSLVASATYVINDILDFRNDLLHDYKRNRPIASGEVGPTATLGMALGVLILSAIVASFLAPHMLIVLLIYVALSLLYSHLGKKHAGLDVILLAGLYVLRVYAGMLIPGLAVSYWLVTFTFLFFASLAAAKRFVELSALDADDRVGGRGYFGADAALMSQFGVSTGVGSCILFVVFALNDAKEVGSTTPSLLVIATPILLYWILHLWTSAHRGLVDSDPVDWALKDLSSVLAAATLAALVVALWLIPSSL